MRSKLSPSQSSSSSNVIGRCFEMSSPSSSIAASAKGSSSPLRAPADATYETWPNRWRNSAAAIGERTELSPQANSTACGRAMIGAAPISPSALALPVQHGDQREQVARRVEVDDDLVLEPLHQELGALVVQRAPAHVDRLDLARRRGADRRVVAVADHEVVLHDALEWRERQVMRDHRALVGGA